MKLTQLFVVKSLEYLPILANAFYLWLDDNEESKRKEACVSLSSSFL